jgi:hypothetical protein
MVLWPEELSKLKVIRMFGSILSPYMKMQTTARIMLKKRRTTTDKMMGFICCLVLYVSFILDVTCNWLIVKLPNVRKMARLEIISILAGLKMKEEKLSSFEGP